MSMILEYTIAACIRYVIINSSYMQSISDRIEISTPINSWKRVLEGAYLYQQGVDPYEGDIFHESPVILACCSVMLKYIPELLPAIFVVCDLVTAFILTRTATLFMLELAEKQSKSKDAYAKDALSLMISEDQLKTIPIYVAAAYLYNPYTILNCVGMATTVFANLFLALAFYGMISGSRVLCCASLAICSVQSLYPVMLILPATLYLYQKSISNCNKCGVIRTITMYALFVTCLLFLSKSIAGSWKFIESTYGFILNVPDLRPNIGLFWYFFTEMFEHFRPLFICAFQINATFLYLIPLTLRLRNEPMLLATSLTALTAIFKSYPSLGDVGFYLALLPMWKHLFNYMQQGFIVGCFFIVTSVLGPTVWHLWIYSRSANANFFFGVTLAFATAQIFLVTDILFAYIKREYSLRNGLSREIDGQPAKLVLE